MKTGVILLLTDCADRSRSLEKSVNYVADCHIVAVGEAWNPTISVIGLIVDASLKCLQTRTWLRRILDQVSPRLLPVVCLTASMSFSAVLEAKAYGASLCLPLYTEPRAVVAALIHQVSPNETVADLTVRRAAERTGLFFDYIFSANVRFRVDMNVVEKALEPVLHAIHSGGLTRWLDAVWAYDDATFQHCLLVAGLVAAFSLDLGLSIADQRGMTRGALVHDVGKTRIPKAILNKPGRLNPDEIALMQTHAAVGHEMLTHSAGCDPITLAVTRHHHEMLDGSGYPDRLSGDAIADPIRLLTICDIYAALIERRAYKASLPPAEAMRILQSMENKLEGGLVTAFGKAIAKIY